VIKKTQCPLLILAIACLFMSCQQGKNTKIDPSEREKIIATAPVLSPEKSMSVMQIEDGFEAHLVAAEPLVRTPVALNFDDKGRMWVAEMEGYMPDAEGNGEEIPNGKIVILTDKDGDGKMDDRKIFLDSLVLPRALCLVDNGILVVEPPKLWFYGIKNDQPTKKVLVDSNYTEGGNAEAQANGLFRAMDNWIYSGGSAKRYRKKGDKWLVEATHLRGQWGISQDDHGRLYYNNNSQNLLGDYFMPGLGANNTDQQSIAGFNEKIVPDTKVYPSRPNTGVNRGYMKNVLDDSLRLTNFTAACGPVLYRGDLFNNDYYNNAFVAEPAANLIKRNILKESGYTTQGKQAYEGKEFIRSDDERFRPVSLYNGPDGALYIVDMYRGIIQHKLFLTDYLKKEINKRSLAQPVNCGRIYKILPTNKQAKPVQLSNDPSLLVQLLQHTNGWVRDKAQQMLIDGKFKHAEPALRKNLKQTNKTIPLIHSLWTMEGLGVLQPEDLLPLLNDPEWQIRMQALSVLPSLLTKGNYQQFVPVLEKMIANNDTLAAPYIAFDIHSIQPFNEERANQLLLTLANKYPNDPYVTGAIISNLKGKEAAFSKKVLAMKPDTNLLINKALIKTIIYAKNNEQNKDLNLLKKQYPRGVSLFKSTCQTCHGTDGNGIASLAPPLNTSDIVNGDPDKLIAIVLYGLSGPVVVNNKLYKDISGEMPGMINNEGLVDEDIAEVLSFIRKNWSNSSKEVKRSDVIKIRKKFEGRQTSFTLKELASWK
jgi:mono/diheme cytochrome c family protein